MNANYIFRLSFVQGYAVQMIRALLFACSFGTHGCCHVDNSFYHQNTSLEPCFTQKGEKIFNWFRGEWSSRNGEEGREST